MKVLFLSSWFPYPPDNGVRIRTYNLIRALSRKHDVFLISLLQDDWKQENAEGLVNVCTVLSLHESTCFRPATVRSVLGFLSSRPRSVASTFDPAVRLAVADAIKSISPDVVVASTLGLVEYVPVTLHVPSVLDEHNCEYAVLKRTTDQRSGVLPRFRYTLGWKKFARWEAGVCRRFDAVTMVSEQDRESLLAAAPDLRRVYVVPNGVDTEHYTMEDHAPRPGELVYNGALTYSANLDAVRYFVSDIYPLLRAEAPHVRLRVTGRTSGADLRGVEDCPGIQLTGYVSDIRDVLKSSEVCVVPLRHGGGSRLKILEAMASGVPVVSTSMGAEGIGCTDGRNLLLADRPAEFAQAVLRLLSDPDLAGRLARNARKLVEDRYDWKVIGDSFVDLVEQTVAERKRR